MISQLELKIVKKRKYVSSDRGVVNLRPTDKVKILMVTLQYSLLVIS